MTETNDHPAFKDKQEWQDLDPDLITEDICIQCARCCKVTLRQPWNQNQEEYLKAMFEHTPKVDVVREGNQIGVVNWCSQLQPDLTCGIYEKRPKICQNYNCFKMANKMKKFPEYFDHIKGLLRAKGIEI